MMKKIVFKVQAQVKVVLTSLVVILIKKVEGLVVVIMVMVEAMIQVLPMKRSGILEEQTVSCPNFFCLFFGAKFSLARS